MTYSTNQQLEAMIQQAVLSIEEGRPLPCLTPMIKNQLTMILLASSKHSETRYQPGNKLVTYNGISQDGTPIQETWGGGSAIISENSVILRNAQPIKYPQGHPLAGTEVRGSYKEDGTFEVDQNGLTVLYNEYVSDVKYVKGAYGIEANEQWQSGLKLQPSYVLQIPLSVGKAAIVTKSGVEINLSGWDYVVIEAKKGKVLSVHGCERSWLKSTYVLLETHIQSLLEKTRGE